MISLRVVLSFGLALVLGLAVGTSAQQDFDFCGELRGFRTVNPQTFGRVTLTLGLTARKTSQRLECPGGVEFENEFSPNATIYQACRSTSNAQVLRILYNVTEFCFDQVQRRNIREVAFDAGIGFANGSQFVQFVDTLSAINANQPYANPVTLRQTIVDNGDYCDSLADGYDAVGAQEVVDLVNLGITLYKVTLERICPYGILVEDSLAPARMLDNACQFSGNPEEYRLRYTSRSFCVIQGNFNFGQGYNRVDTYEVIVTRVPPQAQWIVYENSEFSLNGSTFAGFASISGSAYCQLSSDVFFPEELVQELDIDEDNCPRISNPSVTQPPESPFVVPSPVASPFPRTDEDILQDIIDGTDQRGNDAKNQDIEQIARRAIQADDDQLTGLSFVAASVVNGNTTSLFTNLTPILRRGNNEDIVARALENGVVADISMPMAEGIADTLSSGNQWMNAIAKSIELSNCQPISELLNDVRELARGGVIESDFIEAVAQRNQTLLGCLANCNVLPGFRPGNFTVEVQIQLEIAASTIHEDELLNANYCGEGASGPEVRIPDQSQNRLLVICTDASNSDNFRAFYEVDVGCPNVDDATQLSLEVLEVNEVGKVVESVDPISRLFVIGSQES
eukprot:TRINITY_DN2203_c0_g5_i1.p1 TRINITY_DN2203_c0_g5~~TRINITY_DN2203_c0_g5_i1.p1  ORF type:complete len:624 (-),score=89.61 TRINITY_DN2203_c0_g5_i1:689-2560(-)